MLLKSSSDQTADARTENQFENSTSQCHTSSPLHKIIQYWRNPVRVDSFITTQLLILTFSTGIQDADSLPNFRCFASNQTGNTVMLAIGISGYQADLNGLFNLQNVGMSLAMFVAGAIITGQVGNWLGKRGRAWQFLANLFQTMMVIAAAAIEYQHDTTNDADRSVAWSLAAIGLLAFSSGAQVATARAMQIPEISTAMATAAWVDLVIDPHLLAIKNQPRNRRALFIITLAAGSFVGAIMHSKLNPPDAIVASGAAKALVTLMLLVTKADSPTNMDGEEMV